MERYCSTGQSPQRSVAPTEEEEVTKYASYGPPFAVTQTHGRSENYVNCLRCDLTADSNNSSL
jgi:hypothetical protein